MKIKVKETLAAVELMARDGLPQTVIMNLVGKEFNLPTPENGSYIIPCFDGFWNIAPECVEIEVEE